MNGGHRFTALVAAAAAAIHLTLAPDHLAHAVPLGLGFVLAGIMLAASASLLVATEARWAGHLAGGTCGVVALAYLVHHTVGLPAVEEHHGLDALGVLVTGAEAAAAVVALRPRRLPRRALAVGIVATAVALPTVAVGIPGDSRAPEGCVTPSRRLTLYAEELPRGADGGIRLGYGLHRGAASSPGPLIEMTEGECLAVTLVNLVPEETLRELTNDARWPSPSDHPLGVSLHVHGVKYTSSSDGTLHTGSFVPAGGARTYLWHAAPRVVTSGRVTSSGTAGYWWYHDHMAGNSHGTGGLASGLLGGLVVRRPGDVPPDRSYVVAMGGPRPTINFASYPDTFVCDRDSNRPSPSCLVAARGERVEILVIGVPGTVAKDDFHTFHLHGHNWTDNRTGLPVGPGDDTRLIDAKVIGPSETFGFQIVAGQGVGPGDWMLHCHVQQHSDAGMVSFLRVTDPEAPVSVQPSGPAGHVHDH